MDINPESYPRNTAHHKALSLEDLSHGRKITVVHRKSGEMKRYVVESEPYFSYSSGNKFTPQFDNDKQEVHVNLRLQSGAGAVVAMATSGIGVTRHTYEGQPYWNSYYVTVDSSDERTVYIDPDEHDKWLAHEASIREERVRERQDRQRREYYRENERRAPSSLHRHDK
ncbi:MAG: hypothetical protein ABIR91_04945 [Candidatus Saccharimonadales bacterium]